MGNSWWRKVVRSTSTAKPAEFNTNIEPPDDFFDALELPDNFDPTLDAIQRFEKQIAVQIDLLNELDNKAKSIAHYTTILLGIVIAAVSLTIQSEVASDPHPTTLTIGTFGIGLLLLFLAISQSIHTYLSSVVQYGLEPEFGFNVSTRSLDDGLYLPLALAGYAHAVSSNKEVIDTNARRFRWAPFFLLSGLAYVSVAGFVFIVQLPHSVNSIIIIIVTVILLMVGWYIFTENYLVLERESNP